MNVVTENKVRIFKNINGDKVYYSLGLVKKKQDGTYENGYMMCQFRNGVEVEDKTDIYIKEAWLTFYKKDKITVTYIFINKFETLEQTIDNFKSEVKEKQDNSVWEDFGEQVKMEDVSITDEDLPF